MKSFFSNIKFAWYFCKEQKSVLIKLLVCSIFIIVISVLVPILSAKIIIALTDSLFEQLIFIAIVLWFIENIRNFINFKSRNYSQIIRRKSFEKIQSELARSILKLENKIIDKNGSGVFIQRLIGDTSKLSDVFTYITYNLTNVITDIGIFIAILIINVYAFLFLSFFTVLIYVCNHKKAKKYTEKDKIYRKSVERVSGFTGELVRGIRDIKMLSAEESFMIELNDCVIDANRKQYKMKKVTNDYGYLVDSIRDFSDLLLIILLVYLITTNQMEIASALIIFNYSSKVTSINVYIGYLIDYTKDFNLSAKRIFDIMYDDSFKKEKFGKKHLESVNGEFEFENVSFSYEDTLVLNDLSFKVNANETVAFVGKSGAGKTTIFNLLCKMYEVDSGLIKIDGVDIKSLDKASIRDNITIINQNPYIFNLSIKDNLRLVKENLTEKDMIKACKMACLDDFINTLPNKYDTVVGEGGITLSGGQKQRLAIARALVQKTEIILFDEATSALDNETQNEIQKSIENMKDDYTILIIAHRLSTIINSDRILFINDGTIECSGTHEELYKKSKEYRSLYEKEIQKNG